MNTPVQVIYLEDNPRDAELVRDTLIQTTIPFELRVAVDRAEYEAALDQKRFDLILSDYSLPDYDGRAALSLAIEKQPGVPFILISGTLGEETAVDYVLGGAFDFVLKQRLCRLGPSVLRALSEAEEHRKRRQAEKCLRESEERFRILFDRATVGICLLSCDGEVIEVNESFARMHGYRASDMPHMNLKEIDAPESFQLAPKRIQRVLAGDALTFEVEHYHKDGHLIPLEVSASLIAIGEQNLIQSFHLNITERKEAAEAAFQLAKAKNKFVSVVSHELRSPLATIKEATSLVLEEVLGSLNIEQKEMLDIAKININRLGRLVTNVLLYQKMDAGKMLYDFLENDVTDIIQEAYRNTILATPERKDDLVMNLVAKPPLIKCDKDKIMQVLLNLISNGIKYSERGPIVIETRLDTREIEFSVRDSGQGIYPEEMENIFMPFAHGRGRKIGGTGLGLAISKEIVLAHNGRIWVESEPGKGSTFYFTLPL
jgi:PAS domain S-box-containing protein